MMQIHRASSAALLLLLLLVQSLYAAESKETKSVLVLYSEDRAHPAHELTERGIREAFGSNKLFDVHLYTEYADVSRFSSPAHGRALVDYLHRKYADSKVDAIIAVYEAATNLLLGEARAAFPGAPIVASEVSRSYAENLDRSPSRSFVTGVVMGDNIAGVVDSALRMRPGTKHVALIAGTAPNDVYGQRMFYNSLKPYAGKLERIDLTRLSMEDTLTRVGSLPPDTIVLYSGILRDGAGRIFIPREALVLISQAANSPVFGLYDTFLGYGIVGGRLVSFEQQGKEAAALALRILGGESPASIPFGGDKSYVSLYDGRELKRWNIPETAVPPGSEIRYRQTSYWEEHKQEITGVAVLVIVETVLIFALVTNLVRRRKAERVLRESESKYKALYDGSADGIFLLDDTGTILDGNEAGLRMSGYSLEEIRGTRVVDLIHPEDLKATPSRFQEMLKGETLRIDRRVRKKDGTYLDVEVSSRRVGENLIQGMYRDVTERKRADEERAAASKEIEDLYNNAPCGYHSIDEDGVFVRMNDTELSWLGYTREEIVGKKKFQDVVTTDSLRVFERSYPAFKAQGWIKDLEFDFVRKDGTILPVLLSATAVKDPADNFVMTRSTIFDITHRKLAEAMVQAERQRLYDVLETLPVYVCLLDSDYRMPFANRYFREIFGEPLGRRCHDFLFNRTEPCETCETYTVMKTRAPHHWYWTGPNGKDYDVYDFLFFDTDGSLLILEMGIDITEAKAGQREREKLITELEAKNAELERFIYSVSHDLKSPLITIKTFLGFVGEHIASNNTQDLKPDLDRIDKAAEKMTNLLSEILELSRIGRMFNPPSEAPMADLVNEALELVSGRIAQTGVEVNLAPDLPVLYGDRPRLQEVFQNLIENSIKFMGDQPHPRVEIGTRTDGEEIVLFVRDNGIGIDPVYHERVFGLFDKLDPKAEGTGIGLALVKRIVEVHGGRIWVESDGLEPGSTFCFTLPR